MAIAKLIRAEKCWSETEPLQIRTHHTIIYKSLLVLFLPFAGFVLEVDSFVSQPPETVKFAVDRPFLYSIVFEDQILFAGTYTK